jgi:phage shock protein PspC (stress-responsive transcriptional regulator)
MERRLTRNTKGAVLGGVAAGFADYTEIDPVLVRLIFIVLCIAGGSGLILYVVCWLIMPRDDEQPAGGEAAQVPPADRFAGEVREAGERVVDNLRQTAGSPGRGRLIGGTVLILLGAILLIEQFLPSHWLTFSHLWPLVIIAVGVAVLAQGGRRVTGE